MIQTIYDVFSSSPKRWDILIRNIGVSLHGISGTRWTYRIASVRPFTKCLPGIHSALSELLELNLTAKAKTEVYGTIKYVFSFEYIIFASYRSKESSDRSTRFNH